MPAPIRTVLNAEEDGTLLELSCADGVPHRTKQRATAIRLIPSCSRKRNFAKLLEKALES